MIQDCPQVTITANGTWYFRGANVTEFSYHVHHMDGDISGQISRSLLRQRPSGHITLRRESLE